jgi:hypothetical protein
MPTGIYTRTEEHRKINLGRKHPNRKKYFKGVSVRYKICEFCKKEFLCNYKNFQRNKFCSRSCASKSHPSGRLGKIGGEKQKEAARKMCGELHPMWNGGTSRAYQTGYYSNDYKKWRLSVFTRDSFTCQCCKKVGVYLTAHHIKSFAHYPELRFDIDNGVTLCETCHGLTDNYKGRNKKLTKL